VHPSAFFAGLAAMLFCAVSLAQSAKDGERPPRPANASNARVGGWCDALTGEKKEQCLRDERRQQDKTAKDDLAQRERGSVQRERGPVEVGRKPRDD
jgi:hypothetical protein